MTTRYAPATYRFTVDAVGDPEPVIAQSDCKTIQIIENAGGATANYRVRRPFSNSAYVELLGGLPFTFPDIGGYTKDSIVGYVELVSGSASFGQMES